MIASFKALTLNRPTYRTYARFERQTRDQLLKSRRLPAGALDICGDTHLVCPLDILTSQPRQREGALRDPVQHQRAHVGLVVGAANKFKSIGDLLLRAG